MHARVFVKLRVKSRDELSTLPCCHDVTIDNGKSLGWSLNTFYVRCSDKSHGHNTHAIHLCLCIKAAKLTAISVTTHLGVHGGDAVKLLPLHMF